MAAALLSDGLETAASRTAGLALDGPPSGCSISSSDTGSSGSSASNKTRADVREGDVVEGRYRIGRWLGSGAMGTVFAASHILLDQKVAIKFLVPESLGHPDCVARFVREARATATIKSKHVVRVLDVALREGGDPYIVMEYLEGCDLAAWLRTHGPQEVPVAVDFVLQACDAIAEAHELGIIHRDLKPANLFAVKRGDAVETVKVLDFGISKAAGLVASTAPPGEWGPGAIITEERVPIGSPCYMSPEQMESARDVDPRTDIWALGVTLCELVTGQLPFEGQSLVQVYALIKSGAHLRLREGVPRALDRVIRKCLEPERDRRYRSVRELQNALAVFASRTTATSLKTTRRSDPGSTTGAMEGPDRRVLEPPKVDTTLVSAGGITVPKRFPRGPRSLTRIGFGAAMVVFIAAGTVLVGHLSSNSLHSVERPGSPRAALPSSLPPPDERSPVPPAPVASTNPDTSSPASQTATHPASADIPRTFAKPLDRRQSLPVEALQTAKSSAATARSSPSGIPRAQAMEDRPMAAATASEDPASSRRNLTSSSTTAPSTSSSEDWFPPPVPK